MSFGRAVKVEKSETAVDADDYAECELFSRRLPANVKIEVEDAVANVPDYGDAANGHNYNVKMEELSGLGFLEGIDEDLASLVSEPNSPSAVMEVDEQQEHSTRKHKHKVKKEKKHKKSKHKEKKLAHEQVKNHSQSIGSSSFRSTHVDIDPFDMNLASPPRKIKEMLHRQEDRERKHQHKHKKSKKKLHDTHKNEEGQSHSSERSLQQNDSLAQFVQPPIIQSSHTKPELILLESSENDYPFQPMHTHLPERKDCMPQMPIEIKKSTKFERNKEDDYKYNRKSHSSERNLQQNDFLAQFGQPPIRQSSHTEPEIIVLESTENDSPFLPERKVCMPQMPIEIKKSTKFKRKKEDSRLLKKLDKRECEDEKQMDLCFARMTIGLHDIQKPVPTSTPLHTKKQNKFFYPIVLPTKVKKRRLLKECKRKMEQSKQMNEKGFSFEQKAIFTQPGIIASSKRVNSSPVDSINNIRFDFKNGPDITAIDRKFGLRALPFKAAHWASVFDLDLKKLEDKFIENQEKAIAKKNQLYVQDVFNIGAIQVALENVATQCNEAEINALANDELYIIPDPTSNKGTQTTQSINPLCFEFIHRLNHRDALNNLMVEMNPRQLLAVNDFAEELNKLCTTDNEIDDVILRQRLLDIYASGRT